MMYLQNIINWCIYSLLVPWKCFVELLKMICMPLHAFIYNYNADEREWNLLKNMISTKVAIEEATCILVLIKYDHTRIENCVSPCIEKMMADEKMRDKTKILIIYNEKHHGYFDDERIAGSYKAKDARKPNA
ncbi:hypothetical protein MAR_002768 [Mya arenaria]|uniref:Uncharacterized protein n=1 Tax=Mya arenaria TaxID=6604 RepID=A0ABY7G431_MYAAR|nr:hypothetical protein MAR_002768 [Mya arenaria]